jgi:predicted methyltransferase
MISRKPNQHHRASIAVRSLAFALALSFLAGCGEMLQPSSNAADLAMAIAAADRSDEDKARDDSRKPAEVLAFFGVEPGMTTMDLIAASGWYTEVLAAAVGPEGIVYAQNPALMLQFREGAADKAMAARIANDRLPNVTRLDREMEDLGIEPNSLDFILTGLNLHDVYNPNPEDGVAMLQLAYSLLKPGSVLGVTDHNGNPDANNEELHRIPKQLAIDAATSVGFLVEESDVLANPDDTREIYVFDPTIRGKTDRFVLKLTKPAGG